MAAHQKGTDTIKAQKVEDGKVGPAGELLSWQEVRLWVALLPIHGSHHDLLPSLSSSTSGGVKSDLCFTVATKHVLTMIWALILTGITSEQPEGMSGSCCCG